MSRPPSGRDAGNCGVQNRYWTFSASQIRIPLFLFCQVAWLTQSGQRYLASPVFDDLSQHLIGLESLMLDAFFSELMIFSFSSAVKSSGINLFHSPEYRLECVPHVAG